MEVIGIDDGMPRFFGGTFHPFAGRKCGVNGFPETLYTHYFLNIYNFLYSLWFRNDTGSFAFYFKYLKGLFAISAFNDPRPFLNGKVRQLHLFGNMVFKDQAEFLVGFQCRRFPRDLLAKFWVRDLFDEVFEFCHRWVILLHGKYKMSSQIPRIVNF